MAAYITNVEELTDADPPFVIPAPTPRSVTVYVRTGSATVSTGPEAAAAGSATFTVAAGESWQWFADERADWVEPATITAGAGSDVVVVWQRMKA